MGRRRGPGIPSPTSVPSFQKRQERPGWHGGHQVLCPTVPGGAGCHRRAVSQGVPPAAVPSRPLAGDAAGPGAGAKAQGCISSSLLHSTNPAPTCRVQKRQAALTRVTPRAVQPRGIPGVCFAGVAASGQEEDAGGQGGLEQGKARVSSAPAKPQP